MSSARLAVVGLLKSVEWRGDLCSPSTKTGWLAGRPVVPLALIRRESVRSLTSYGGKGFCKIESQRSIAPYLSGNFCSSSIRLASRSSIGRIGIDSA